MITLPIILSSEVRERLELKKEEIKVN